MFRSSRLSRWALAAGCCAVVDFIAVQALLIGRLVSAVRAPLIAGSFAGIYLVITGSVILLTFGALLHWAPASEAALPDKKFVPTVLVLLETGAAAVVGGLSAQLANMMWFAPYLLLGGSALIAAGSLLAVACVAPMLLRTTPSVLPGHLLLASFVFLVLTLLPGLVSMSPYALPGSDALLTLPGDGMGFAALAALGGWLVPSVIGACYKLLPVFMPAPDGRGNVSKAVGCLCITGTALTMIVSIVNGGAMTALTAMGPLIVALGIILYCAELSHARIYGVRTDPRSRGRAAPRWHHLPHRSTR